MARHGDCRPRNDRGGREIFVDLRYGTHRAVAIDGAASDRRLAFCASGLYDGAFAVDRAGAWTILSDRYPQEIRFRIFAVHQRAKESSASADRIADEIVALERLTAGTPGLRATLRRLVLWQRPTLSGTTVAHPIHAVASTLGVELDARDLAAEAKVREDLSLLRFSFLVELDHRTCNDDGRLVGTMP